MQNIIEVHIAAPKLDEELTSVVIESLNDIGLPETDYFLNVRDVNPITPGCSNGHDLQNPGTMSTVTVYSIKDAVNLVRTAMARLRELGVEGTNFEIERVMRSGDDSVHSFSLEDTMPEFIEVPNAPIYENHLLYNGMYSSGMYPRAMALELPSEDEIIEFVRSSTGQAVNQIVDFANVSRSKINLFSATMISRVATIYQPSHAAAAETDGLMRNAKKSLGHLGNPRIVTEQVLIVGEFK